MGEYGPEFTKLSKGAQKITPKKEPYRYTIMFVLVRLKRLKASRGESG